MYARHVTLTANTVTTITMDRDYNYCEVINVDGTAPVYFTVNGPAPTVGGNDTYVLPATINGIEVQPPTADLTAIRLISGGTPKVAVRGWDS